MKPAATVHVLSIGPDGPSGDDESDELEETGEHEAAGVDKLLEHAFEAAQSKDREGWMAAMKSAIHACVEECMGEEHGHEEDKEEGYRS